MDENLLDKNGNPNRVKIKANEQDKVIITAKWLDSTSKNLNYAQDIKCELQLALDFWEPEI